LFIHLHREDVGSGKKKAATKPGLKTLRDRKTVLAKIFFASRVAA